MRNIDLVLIVFVLIKLNTFLGRFGKYTIFHEKKRFGYIYFTVMHVCCNMNYEYKM